MLVASARHYPLYSMFADCYPAYDWPSVHGDVIRLIEYWRFFASPQAGVSFQLRVFSASRVVLLLSPPRHNLSNFCLLHMNSYSLSGTSPFHWGRWVGLVCESYVLHAFTNVAMHTGSTHDSSSFRSMDFHVTLGCVNMYRATAPGGDTVCICARWLAICQYLQSASPALK